MAQALFVVVLICGAIALLALCLSLALLPGLILWVAILGTAILCWLQLRAMRQRALAALVAVAVDKQVPLAPLLSAYAYDLPALRRGKVRRLAELLRRGNSLGVAVAQTRGALPPEATLATQLGEQTGTLPSMLRHLNQANAAQTELRQAVLGRLFYVGCLLFLLPSVMLFMAFEIAPSLIYIFNDFEVELPLLTRLVFAVCNAVWIDWGWLTALLLLASWMALIYCFVCAAGGAGLPWGLGWITRRSEAVTVLRALAACAERGRPIPGVLDMLAQSYPRHATRARLQLAAIEVGQGRPWPECLARNRLIGRTDAALIEAATRAGNLPWALDEIASSSQRRLNYRLQALLQFSSPVLVLLLGLLILFYVTGYFLPLAKIIASLT